MQLMFQNILESYQKAKQEGYSGHKVAHLIRKEIVEEIEFKASINTETFKLEGSAGRGNWAEIPWIAVFDRDITETATQGYYIVYLFRADMKGLYLSLNQGWTFFKKEYGSKEGKEKIKLVSNFWRKELSSTLNDFSFENINLHCVNDLGKGYELGHICGKYYSLEKLPKDKELIDDLRNLLGVYRELKGRIGKQSIKLTNKSIVTFTEVAESTQDELSAAAESGYDEQAYDLPVLKPKQNLLKARMVWERRAKYISDIKEKSNHQCEFDPTHQTFLSKRTKKNFVEAHHLIPLEFQYQFQNSLDVPANIVALCPNCHRAIHGAVLDYRSEMIECLYEQRREELRKCGLDIELADLLELYE